MSLTNLKKRLKSAGLRITPQRLSVLEAVMKLNHPTAEIIFDYVTKVNPNVAIGTVYKILEVFVNRQIIKKIMTDKDFVRYDSVTLKHHHIYNIENNRIDDYYDEGLNDLLNNYFENRKIKNFEIKELKLSIIGKFKE